MFEVHGLTFIICNRLNTVVKISTSQLVKLTANSDNEIIHPPRIVNSNINAEFIIFLLITGKSQARRSLEEENIFPGKVFGCISFRNLVNITKSFCKTYIEWVKSDDGYYEKQRSSGNDCPDHLQYLFVCYQDYCRHNVEQPCHYFRCR